MMNDLFVDTYTEKPQTIGYAEACNRLKKYNPDTMFPAQITYSVLARYGFPQINVRYKNDFMPYSQPSIVFIGQDEDGNYFMDVEYIRTEANVLEAYEDYRKERNNLLRQLDWVEASSEVTDDTKEQIALYKQILRDLPNSDISLEAVINKVFPPSPTITYKTNKKASHRATLSDKHFEQIRTYKPKSKVDIKNWNNFLSLWESYNFTRDLDLVNKLIQLVYKKNLELS